MPTSLSSRPTGNGLGFFSGGKLKKVSVSGGAAVILCDAPTPNPTASWGANDSIVFTPHSDSPIFEGEYVSYGPRAVYDVTPDGQRFLMVKESEEESAVTQLNVELNWFEELKRLVPGRP